MNRKSILIVDDDDVTRLLLSQALSAGADYQLYEAVDGSQALDQFATHAIDLVLLDVELPTLDGFEVCRCIRNSQKGSGVPIVMITGSDDTDSIERAYQLGATDFIAKPLNWALLGYRLRYILRTSANLDALQQMEKRLDQAQQIARLGYWELNLTTDRLLISRQLRSMLQLPGLSFNQGLEQLVNLVHPDDRIAFKLVLRQSSFDGCRFNQDLRLLLADNKLLYVNVQGQQADNGGLAGSMLMGTMQDVSELKESQQRLTHMAHHDALTDLPNRTLFLQMFERGIQRAERMQRKLALLFLDLDRFKNINDSLGHGTGDLLLQEVARRLKQAIRNYDVVARFGGDEFAVMLDAIDDEHDALHLSKRIQQVFASPFYLGDHTLYTAASIGISLYPDNGTSSEQLLKNADTAMYQAKGSEQHQLAFYSDALTSATIKRWQLENELRQALDQGLFSLLYQPKILADSGQMSGVEALIRWRRDAETTLLPEEFIPIAEDTGLIIPIGNWVIREAIQQLQRWQGTECSKLSIAVNISGRQLLNDQLCEFIASELQQAGVAAERLELEITERYLIPNSELPHCLKQLERLCELGVRVAIDDFGIGYSSLSQLKHLPISSLKIDRSFVKHIAESKQDQAVVSSIINLASSLQLQVVAEGVETESQLAQVNRIGCHLVQGFIYSHPVSAEQIASQLHEQRLRTEI